MTLGKKEMRSALPLHDDKNRKWVLAGVRSESEQAQST